jgi:hypothetical protein
LVEVAPGLGLVIELKTRPTTRFPRDPRDLGVALRQIQLEKSP